MTGPSLTSILVYYSVWKTSSDREKENPPQYVYHLCKADAANYRLISSKSVACKWLLSLERSHLLTLFNKEQPAKPKSLKFLQSFNTLATWWYSMACTVSDNHRKTVQLYWFLCIYKCVVNIDSTPVARYQDNMIDLKKPALWCEMGFAGTSRQ